MEHFPDAVEFGHTPCLSIASSRFMGSISIHDLRQLCDTSIVHKRYHGCQIGTRRLLSIFPIDHVICFGERRERPCPRGSVMICGFSARIFIALIGTEVWSVGVVQTSAVCAIHGQSIFRTAITTPIIVSIRPHSLNAEAESLISSTHFIILLQINFNFSLKPISCPASLANNASFFQ